MADFLPARIWGLYYYYFLAILVLALTNSVLFAKKIICLLFNFCHFSIAYLHSYLYAKMEKGRIQLHRKPSQISDLRESACPKMPNQVMLQRLKM